VRLCVCLLVAPAVVRAQALPPTWTAVATVLPDATPPAPLLRRPWVRPVSSFLVPGAGQLLGAQARGLVYLAAELWVASRALESGRRGRQSAARFRDLAFDVARRQFSAARVDGGWDYYESMEKFVESGAYNAAGSAGAFAPEPDTGTFNGSVWRLARHTFFVNPDSIPDPLSVPYRAALAFYQTHAVGDALRWSWRGARLEQDIYRREIAVSDDAFRARTNYLGALVLNHVASTIDALISLRLGARRTALPRLRFGASPDDVVLGWHAEF
jgi:hypothetical protein